MEQIRVLSCDSITLWPWFSGFQLCEGGKEQKTKEIQMYSAAFRGKYFEKLWMYIKRSFGYCTCMKLSVRNIQQLAHFHNKQGKKLHRVHFTCVDVAKLLMKFSNTQKKQLHHPVIEGSRSPRWTNSNWTVHGCGGRFYPPICQKSWNNSKLSAENYEWEPVFWKKEKVTQLPEY